MRTLPGRYLTPDPIRSQKRATAKTKHISAPLKGLSLSSRMTAADPLTAPILDNWNVDEDRIRVRAGTALTYTHAAALPVWCLVPYYGTVNKLAAATNGELVLLDGTVIKSGFTSNDWHWTSFSNLSATEYTIMVNGSDGVWSWDGANTSTDPAPVTVTSLSNTSPAKCTVAPADIGKFTNGMVVTIAGGDATHAAANGPKIIDQVGAPANTFALVGVNLSAAAGPQTTGVTADVPSTGTVKEAVTAPSYAPHIVVNQFDIVLSHMNRLWFADKSNLSVYYLPLQQKSGEVAEFPLNAVFRRGGHIQAMYTWTSGDGGVNVDDMLCIFSSNGEVVLYSGVDPDSDFNLVGIFRFDSPMSKHSVINYGGELYVLISTGLVPMSTLLKVETDHLGNTDKNIFSEFFQASFLYRDRPGWSVLLNPSSGRLICNTPMGSDNSYRQMVRFMPNTAWATWSGLASRCWAWIDDRVFFGSDDGKVYEINPRYLNDSDGTPTGSKPIRADVQTAWSTYGSPGIKQFKMVLPYIITDGTPRPSLDFRVDYDDAAPFNQPDVTAIDTGAAWDTATWDVDFWAGGQKNWNNWQGVAALGRIGAVRMVVSITNCSFSLAGMDVLFEEGGVFG